MRYVRFLIPIVLVMFLTSCGFDNSFILQRLDTMQQRIDYNSFRIKENSKRIGYIEAQLERIKERIRKQMQNDSILSAIPPAVVVDNLSVDEANNSEKKPTKTTITKKTIKIEKNLKQSNKKQAHSINNIKIAAKPKKEKKVKVSSIPPPIVKVATTDKGPNDKGNSIDSRQYKQGSNLTPKELYKKALSLYFKGNYKQASILFEEFIAKYKTSDLYDNSLYWLAYCNIHMGDIKKAIALLKRIINEFPYSSVSQGGKTDAAIFSLIRIYKKMGKKKQARMYKNQLLKRFPLSSYTKKIKGS